MRSSSVSSGDPGSTRCVWSAANAVSRPVTPNGASSNGTSFSWRACGAWSVATHVIAPSPQRVAQSLAIVGRAKRRVHLHVRVERADHLVGEDEMVRGDLGGCRRRRPRAPDRALRRTRSRRGASGGAGVLRRPRARGRVRPSRSPRSTGTHRDRARRRPRLRARGRRAKRRLLAMQREPPAREPLYWSARRMSPAETTGPPSSVNAAAPRSELGHLGQLAAAWPLLIAAMKPVGTTASARACSTRAPSTAAESTTGSVFGIARIAQYPPAAAASVPERSSPRLRARASAGGRAGRRTRERRRGCPRSRAGSIALITPSVTVMRMTRRSPARERAPAPRASASRRGRCARRALHGLDP